MVQKTILNSGLTVLTDEIPNFPSFAISYTLKQGSRAEKKSICGIYHFIEHMMFKGTKTLNLKEIADLSDRLGGRLNAFTSKEITHYYVRGIDEKINDAFALLTDMVMESTFPGDEFEKEQKVILQEIKESEDNPESNCFELFFENYFQSDPLAFPIAGKEKTIKAMNRDVVFDYYKKNYQPQNLIFSAVGKVNHQHCVAMAEKYYQNFPAAAAADFTYPPAGGVYTSVMKHKSSLKQLYVVIGFKGLPQLSEHRSRFLIMNEVFGAGMSSRLFQKIREEKGLAYTISSFQEGFFDCGVHAVFSIIEVDQLPLFLKSVRTEIDLIKNHGITANEFSRAKDHIKSSILLSLENNNSKLRFNINSELYLRRSRTIEEVMEEINRVTPADVEEQIRQSLNLDECSILIYGNTRKYKNESSNDFFNELFFN